MYTTPSTAITDEYISALQPDAKDKTIAVGIKHLYLLIRPNGSKLWHFRYAHKKNAQCKITIKGGFPKISLSEALAIAENYNELLEKGIDPKDHIRDEAYAKEQMNKKKSEAELREKITFDQAARNWIKDRSGYTESTKTQMLSKFERFLFPRIGNLRLHDIDNLTLFNIFTEINYREKDKDKPAHERRPILESIRRMIGTLSKIFAHYKFFRYISENPCTDLHKQFEKPTVKNFSALLDPIQIGELQLNIDESKSSEETKIALELSLHLYCRSGNLRNALWSQFNFQRNEWTIPRKQMKIKKNRNHDFIIPLSPTVVDLLRKLEKYTKHRSQYLFPSIKDPKMPMSDGTMLQALRRMGYKQGVITVHGSRATARSLGREKLKISQDVLELNLDHSKKDSYNGAYDRAMLTDERREAMCRYSQYLIQCKEDARALRARKVQELTESGFICSKE